MMTDFTRKESTGSADRVHIDFEPTDGLRQSIIQIDWNTKRLSYGNPRYICRPVDNAKKTHICQLETRSRSTGSRCSDVNLGSNSGVCFPSILSNKQVLGTNQEGSRISDSNHSSVAKPAMVLTNTGTIDRPSHFIAANERVVNVTSGGNSSATNNRSITVSGMETLRQRFKTEGFSEESVDLLLEAPKWLTQWIMNHMSICKY